MFDYYCVLVMIYSKAFFRKGSKPDIGRRYYIVTHWSAFDDIIVDY